MGEIRDCTIVGKVGILRLSGGGAWESLGIPTSRQSRAVVSPSTVLQPVRAVSAEPASGTGSLLFSNLALNSVGDPA